jgi:hypothetical protein
MRGRAEPTHSTKERTGMSKPKWMREEKRHVKPVKTTIGRKRRMELERERILRSALPQESGTVTGTERRS